MNNATQNTHSHSFIKRLSIYSFMWFVVAFHTHSQSLKGGEILGRPTDKSITIQLLFDDTVEVKIQYGLISGVYDQVTSSKIFPPGIPAEIELNGLQANTAYFYRVQYRLPSQVIFQSRPEHNFQTKRSIGNGYTFIVQADPHLDTQSDTALYQLCLNNQLDDHPDFMIDLGDFIMTDKLKNKANIITRDTITYRCELLRSYYEKICHSVPLYIALGNHEGEAGWNLNGTANNIGIWNTIDRKKYFLNPYPDSFYSGDTIQHPYVGLRENYYAWHWGDALFIVLDPYWYTKPKPDSLNGWRWTLGETQYKWLQTTLEKSSAKFKFVFAHQLIGGDPDGRGGVEFANLYEWGGYNLDGTYGFNQYRPGWSKPIKDLLKEHQVNIFFHGHDHFFGKQDLACLVYQETPQPSHPNFSNVNYASTYGYKSGIILPQSGHLRVHVDSNGVKVEYVRAYLSKNETPNRRNKDISATYYIGAINCYDSLSTGTPVIWNKNYMDELVYPNPFSSETKIEFTLNQSEKIELSIYNENGQLIKKLILGNELAAGSYSIIWDGKNYLGNDQANGIYIYHLHGSITGNRTGKIILKR
ncbi:MAG: FlgD immunoglobulin-like domain containing protein [Bacteroidia bacterium]